MSTFLSELLNELPDTVCLREQSALGKLLISPASTYPSTEAGSSGASSRRIPHAR
jgi:hypothetical protein